MIPDVSINNPIPQDKIWCSYYCPQKGGKKREKKNILRLLEIKNYIAK